MKTILLIIGIIFSPGVFSQKLIGSKLLPCKQAIGHNIYRNRIISEERSGDSLVLEIGFVHNCSAVFAPALTSRNDSLFIELPNISEVYAACDCCFSMLFYISGMADRPYTLFVDSTEFVYSKYRYIDFPPNEKIPENQLKNERNMAGKRIGYWKVEFEKRYSISYYGDGSTPNNLSIWRKSFNAENKLEGFSMLKITPDITESFHMSFDAEEYLRILAEIEATR